MLLPFQGATAPTWEYPGCRYACPGLSAPLAFQAALAKIIVAISMPVSYTHLTLPTTSIV